MPEYEMALARVKTREQRKRTDLFDNIKKVEVCHDTGTSNNQGLKRLECHRLDLLNIVFEKELSVHVAMIEAGFN